jgi:hypothetical protein
MSYTKDQVLEFQDLICWKGHVTWIGPFFVFGRRNCEMPKYSMVGILPLSTLTNSCAQIYIFWLKI